jgi:peptidoglycan/LPS O-acetylase OafA/YrhL
VESYFFWIDLLAGVAAATLFAGFAQRPAGRLSQLLARRGPRWLGQSSYSLYLIHLPVLGLLYWGVVVRLTEDNEARFVLLLVIGVPATVLASRMFWWAFERPFMQNRSIRELRGAWRVSGPTNSSG